MDGDAAAELDVDLLLLLPHPATASASAAASNAGEVLIPIFVMPSKTPAARVPSRNEAAAREHTRARTYARAQHRDRET